MPFDGLFHPKARGPFEFNNPTEQGDDGPMPDRKGGVEPTEIQSTSLIERLRKNSVRTRPLSTNRAVGSVGTGKAGKAPDGTPVLLSGEEDALSGHEAYSDDLVTHSGFRGPRGKRGEGEGRTPEYVPAGLPAAAAGPPRMLTHILKEETRPQTPYNFERYLDQNVSVATGRLIDKSAGFPIRGLQIDNYSKQWLYIPGVGRYVMPYCVGFQCPVFTAPNKIEVDAAAPPGLTQPALASTTQVFCVSVVEREVEYSPGLSILNAGALP